MVEQALKRRKDFYRSTEAEQAAIFAAVDRAILRGDLERSRLKRLGLDHLPETLSAYDLRIRKLFRKK